MNTQIQMLHEEAVTVLTELGRGGLVTVFAELLSYYFQHTEAGGGGLAPASEELRQQERKRLEEYIYLLPFIARANDVLNQVAAATEGGHLNR